MLPTPLHDALHCHCAAPMKGQVQRPRAPERAHRFRLLQPHIGEFILRQRPAAVVVETALDARHGARTGNVFASEGAAADGLPSSSSSGRGFFPRMFCQLSAHLAGGSDPAASQLWRVRSKVLWLLWRLSSSSKTSAGLVA